MRKDRLPQRTHVDGFKTFSATRLDEVLAQTTARRYGHLYAPLIRVPALSATIKRSCVYILRELFYHDAHSQSRYNAPQQRSQMAKAGPPTQYKHEPVDTTQRQIRLLQLAFPRDAQEPPTAQLKTYDIDVAPPYIALSYTRGEPTGARTRVTMRINGSLFWISQSLHMALSQIQRTAERHPNSGILQLPIWIDQICIDQRNAEERNIQGKTTASIYRNAQSVIVWLSHIASIPGKSVFEDKTFATEILQHDFFTGLWIVQEILVARDLYLLYGSSVFLPWSEVERTTLSSLRELHRKDALRHRGLLQLLMRKTAIGSMSLQDCIARFCYQKCSNPLDKVFGLMSLVTENEQVVIDYARSVPEVFLDVVRLLHSRDLALGQTGRNASGGSSAGLNRSILQELARQMGLGKRDLGLGATRRFLDLIFKSTSLHEIDSREITHRRTALQVGFEGAFSNVLRIPDRWWIQSDGERRYIQWIVESRSCLHTALSSMAKDSKRWIPETSRTSITCKHRTCKMSLPMRALPAPPVTSGTSCSQAIGNDGNITQVTSDLCNEQSITAHSTPWMAGGVARSKKLHAGVETKEPTTVRHQRYDSGSFEHMDYSAGTVTSDTEKGEPMEKGDSSEKEEPSEEAKPSKKGKSSEGGKPSEKRESPQADTRCDIGIRGRLLARLWGTASRDVVV